MAASGSAVRVMNEPKYEIELADETVRRVGRLADSFRVVRCRAASARRYAAYAPIAAGLRPWLAEVDDTELARIVGPGAEPLATLLPELGPRLGAAMQRRRRDG